jgi:hypothetical protein
MVDAGPDLPRRAALGSVDTANPLYGVADRLALDPPGGADATDEADPFWTYAIPPCEHATRVRRLRRSAGDPEPTLRSRTKCAHPHRGAPG